MNYCLRRLLLLVGLTVIAACANIPAPPSADPRPRRQLNATAFFPLAPSTRSFSYSRTGPDGTKLLGTLSIFIAQIAAPPDHSARLTIRGLVYFHADAIVFSPEQGRAIRPANDWPPDRSRYPMQLPDMEELRGFTASIAAAGLANPSDLAIFWAGGIRDYIGFAHPPTSFDLAAAQQPSGDDGPMIVRGSFKDGSANLGAFLFTFRKGRSLTGLTATLPDGSVIALIERPDAPATPQPHATPPPRQPPPDLGLKYARA